MIKNLLEAEKEKCPKCKKTLFTRTADGKILIEGNNTSYQLGIVQISSRCGCGHVHEYQDENLRRLKNYFSILIDIEEDIETKKILQMLLSSTSRAGSFFISSRSQKKNLGTLSKIDQKLFDDLCKNSLSFNYMAINKPDKSELTFYKNLIIREMEDVISDFSGIQMEKSLLKIINTIHVKK